MKKIIKSIICLALACLVAMSLAATVSFAGKADSASDGLYMSGSNVVCGEGVTLTETESGLWTLTKENVTAEDKMEFSLYAALPEDGAYKLEIASSAGAGVSINENPVTLSQASTTQENELNVYNIRNAEFNRGTNEIKFSVEASEFNLGYVNITAYSDSLSGADYSYTSNAWVTDASTDYNGTTYNYQSFNGVENPFRVEYTFYVKEDGEYSLDAIMSYPDKSGYTDARYYSTASVMCDGILADNVTSEDWGNKMLGKNVYTGLMLKKGIHTLTVTPDITTESKKYNLYVGDLNFTKTGDYVNTGIEIMGNEYTSLGGMVLEVKNDLTMVSTGETFTDWKFFKEDMTATDTDTVTYSFDVQKAGYYSFEGWINSNSNQYVSASKLLIDSKEYSLTEDSTVTKASDGSGVYITKKTISNKEPKLWLDEGKHKVELVISPRTDDNAQINARVWKLAFTLISDDDIYIPAINYVDESAIAPTVAASAFKDEAMEYYSFRDDNMTDEFVLTYKFTPSVTAKYTFEGWASAIYSYLSEPKFYLDGIQMETEEDKSIKSEDGFIRRHFAEGIELTAGQEYTLKVKSQPKISGGNINAKLWKMTFNREVGESYMTSVINDNNSLKGSFFVKSQSQAKDAYVLYAQYDKDGRFLDVVIEDFELKQSDNFSGTSFTVDLPENADSAIKSKLFIMTTDLYPLFNAMEVK